MVGHCFLKEKILLFLRYDTLINLFANFVIHNSRKMLGLLELLLELMIKVENLKVSIFVQQRVKDVPMNLEGHMVVNILLIQVIFGFIIVNMESMILKHLLKQLL